MTLQVQIKGKGDWKWYRVVQVTCTCYQGKHQQLGEKKNQPINWTSLISRVPDLNGISQACYIVEIYHSGLEPSIWIHILRVPDQIGVSLLYIMLEIHHSGREPSILYVHTKNSHSHKSKYTLTFKTLKQSCELEVKHNLTGMLVVEMWFLSCTGVALIL